jgi:hypothetical protein
MEIGMRISQEAGVSFVGLDEVNAALQRGAKVLSIKPGEALFRKLGEDEEKVRLAYSGFRLKILLDE